MLARTVSQNAGSSRILVGGTGRDVPPVSRPVPGFSNNHLYLFSSLFNFSRLPCCYSFIAVYHCTTTRCIRYIVL